MILAREDLDKEFYIPAVNTIKRSTIVSTAEERKKKVMRVYTLYKILARARILPDPPLSIKKSRVKKLQHRCYIHRTGTHTFSLESKITCLRER